MTLSKIVASGKIVSNPEKRFSQNNFPVLSFSMDINPENETVVRVIRVGSAAEAIADKISMGDTVVVEGQPQIETVKGENGKDKRIFVINATNIAKINFEDTSNSVRPNVQKSNTEEIVQFSNEEVTENLIDEDEIPF